MRTKLSLIAFFALAIFLRLDANADVDSADLPECATMDNRSPEYNFLCGHADLIDANVFSRARNISVAPQPTPSVAPDTQENRLTDGPQVDEGTAYISNTLRWRAGLNGAKLSASKLAIPVCWRNPRADAAHKEARALVKTAVKATWQKHASIVFTGWDKCVAGVTGGVRIHVADTRPKARLGTLAGDHDISMFLNFNFENWSTTCAADDKSGDDIEWRACVYSIAVHEFGHILGYYHEQDRLFVDGSFHDLDEESLAKWKSSCADRDVESATVKDLPKDAISGYYDPLSVMNYCFDIYNHFVRLSEHDVQALVEAYPSQR